MDAGLQEERLKLGVRGADVGVAEPLLHLGDVRLVVERVGGAVARKTGKNWWEWVFIGTRAVLHVIQPSRGKAILSEFPLAIQDPLPRIAAVMADPSVESRRTPTYCYRQ
jgi:hypothetical protein